MLAPHFSHSIRTRPLGGSVTGSQLIFVHGLGGDPKATWGLFPELIAADTALGKVETFSFGYPTSLFRLPFSSKSPRVQTLAGALRTFIDARSPDGDDLILVCHSLGGIIARRYLVDEVKRQAKLRVRGLLLYAVPMSGAGLAEVASHISWKHNQLRQLCRDSDLLRDLEADWETLGLSTRLRVRHVVAAQDDVVAESSARSSWGAANVDVIADRGHIDVVKPRSADDLPYLILRNFVRSFAPAAPRVEPRRPSRDSIQLNRFQPLDLMGETEHSRIQKCLYNGATVVLKRTREDLCDVEALRAVMRARADNELLPAKVRPILHVPQSVWSEDGFVWEVQEFVDGVSLGALIKRNRPIYGRFLDACGSALFRILDAMSKIGVVHRDLNPYNIVLTQTGEFRLIDWTFCLKPGGTREVPVTTPGFTAPEQERAESTHASDWFAAGATLYFLTNAEAPDYKDAASFAAGLDRLTKTGRRLEYDVGGEWRKGLSTLVSDVLEQDVRKRPIPAKPYWKESSLAGSPLDTAEVLKLGSKSHLVVARGSYWVLPRDVSVFSDLLDDWGKLGGDGHALRESRRIRLTALHELRRQYAPLAGWA